MDVAGREMPDRSADVRDDTVDTSGSDRDVGAGRIPGAEETIRQVKQDKVDKISEVKQDNVETMPVVKQDKIETMLDLKRDKIEPSDVKHDKIEIPSDVKHDKIEAVSGVKQDKPEQTSDVNHDKTDTTSDVNHDKTDTKLDVKQDKTVTKSDVKQHKTETKSDVKQDKAETKSDLKQDKTEGMLDVKQDKIERLADVKQGSAEKCVDDKLDAESPQESTRAPPPGQLFGVRHLQTLMMFLCLVISYSLRVNLSVAIVAMVDKEHANPDFEEFDWSDATTATILSSFFWGYVITQIPAGQLAERVGPKMLLVGSATTCSIFTILTPVLASWGGWQGVCFSRVMQGLAQGFVFPCIHTLLAKWAPVEERGRMSTYSYAGAQFGTILSLSLCGVIAESAAGWPTDFYLFGGLGICWAVLWFFVGSNSPAEHPFISKEERAYIEDSLSSCVVKQEKRTTPWRYFFTSVPLWALIIVHSGQNWGFWTLLTEMPNYMKSVLNFDLKSNGMLSALPYLVMWLLSFVFSWVSDFINKKKYISLSASRKLFNTIAHWGPAITLIVLSYSNKDTPYVAVALLTIAVGVNAGTYVGFQVNHIDLSPNYAGTMMGITNCIANILSIIAPLAVGGILTDSTSVVQWRTIFFISSGVYFVGNLIFIVFGKAEVQPWNDPDTLASGHIDEEQQQGCRRFITCIGHCKNIC